jgi:CoA:oxalate CoA-transferase
MPDSTSLDAPTAQRPLAGLRVLDLTRVLAGPFCTMILADLGAEVVKIERPEVGDDARHFGPFLPSGASAYFASINRGKKSIVLDLRQQQDQQTFLLLVEQADVLVENFRPGTLESMGLPPARLRETNPRLILASASGFGQTGERSRRPAYDIIVQAMSGLMSITGCSPQEPVRVGTSISDLLTGMFTAIGVLAALRGREQMGRGAHLDLAMLDCTVAALENAVSRYEVTREVPLPLGTRHPSIAPFQAFHTADTPIVVATGNDVLWRKLCGVLEAPDLATDPRLADNKSRCTHLEYMEQALNQRLRGRPAAEWLARLDAAGVPAAPIRNVADVVHDPHLSERGVLHAMQDDSGATFLTAGSPIHIDGATPPLSPHAPRLGEHTEEVLRQWLGPT